MAELKLVSFVCSGAPMSALNLLGLKRRELPAAIRFVRVGCAGRTDPAFLLKLLEGGVDGVLVLGCAPELCRHRWGSSEMEKRVHLAKNLLSLLGWPQERIEYSGLNPWEDDLLLELVTRWAGEMKAIGPNPRRRESLAGSA